MTERQAEYRTGQGVMIEEDASEAAINARRPLSPSLKRAMAPGPPAPPPSDLAITWLALLRQRRSLEEQLKAVVSSQEQTRQRLLEQWSLDGTTKEVVDGTTIHLQRKLYPKVADKGRLTAALLERGYTDLLTVDEKAFAIYVTTCDEEGQPLPTEIAKHVPESFERYSITVRLK